MIPIFQETRIDEEFLLDDRAREVGAQLLRLGELVALKSGAERKIDRLSAQ